MCGRYASSRGAAELASHFGAVAPEEGLAPSWNVAPTDPVTVVLEREGQRSLKVVRWGLVPSWARDAKGGARLINARSETLASKPAFRSAYARRRCLVPADGYYEWQRVDGRTQPWFLSPRQAGPLAMAGLYEVWKEPAADRWLWTCTVITTAAADDTGQIHDRTPLLVPPDAWQSWLDPTVPEPVHDLLRPAVIGELQAWPVGRAVGNVRNNTPELITPVVG